MFNRRCDRPLEQLSMWYSVPPADTKDALQAAHVKGLEDLDVSPVEGPRRNSPYLASFHRI